MKKLFTLSIATLIAITSLPSISATAAEATTNLSINTTLLDEAIVVDGVIINAGSTAITVEIIDNTGFDSADIKINAEGYDIITSNNEVLISSDVALGDSLICGAENDNVVAFATASANANFDDGKMFTFYANTTAETCDIPYIVADNFYLNNNVTESFSISPSVSPAFYDEETNAYYYKVGDVNDDKRIDASDASSILHAIGLTGRDNLSYKAVKGNLRYYFPDIADIRAAFIRNEYDDPESKMNAIVEDDAKSILDYYSGAAVGDTYKGNTHLGEIYPVK